VARTDCGRLVCHHLTAEADLREIAASAAPTAALWWLDATGVVLQVEAFRVLGAV